MRTAIREIWLEENFPAAEGVVEAFTVAPLLREARALLPVMPDVTSFEQIGQDCHYRFDFADGRMIGHGELCAVSDGIYVQIQSGEIPGPHLIEIVCPDVMRIRIAAEGLESYAPAGQKAVLADGPSAMIVFEPADQPPARVVFDGRQSLAYVFADRTALQQLCDGREHELPSVMQAFLRGELERTAVRRLTIRPELLRCLQDMQRCDNEGWGRTLFMRSKATELFCHVLKMLEFDEGFSGPDASLSTARGVLRAQQILAERFAQPPSLDRLAREVGLSRSSLCAGFRQILEQSVFSFIQDRRMERALVLLTEGQEPISEIAHAVGYSHLSSFTVAVQRRFGMSPSELRRSALAMDA